MLLLSPNTNLLFMMQSVATQLSTVKTLSLRIKDFAQLIKFRLTTMVVFSTGIGYLLANEAIFSFNSFFLLLISGFLITGAANGINQIIEKDLDKLMTRTQNRPIAQGRLSVWEASIFLTLIGVLGVYVLGTYFNVEAALVGGASLFIYAFVYTPLKQKTHLSVWFGALAGATPPMIGYVAASGTLDATAWFLFAFQFVWQFPHFWALAWVLNDEYNKAGFYLLPTKEGRTKKTAFITLSFTVLLFPILFWYYQLGHSHFLWNILLLVFTVHFTHQAFRHYNEHDLRSARRLMFGSFYYLPVVQLIMVLEKFL